MTVGSHKPPLIVTSDRLRSDAVANRMFPKVRSWFALGAPLELLSPLSVARILVLVGSATWLIGGSIGALDAIASIVLTAISVLWAMRLMRLRALTHPGCSMVSVGLAAMVTAALFTSDDGRRVAVLAVLLTVMSIFIGLFFVAYELLGMVALVYGVLVASSRLTNDGMGFGDGLMVSAFIAALSAMTAFTARTSRVSGSTDPETGVKNIRGMVDQLARRDSADDVVVATIFLSGVAEVRDALGHDAGSELVRRAVEDLGQVLPSHSVIGRGASDDVLVLLRNDSRAKRTTQALVSATVKQIGDAIGVGRYLVGDIEVALTTHVGIAVATESAGDAGEIVRQSALAARSARVSGRLSDSWDGRTTTLTAEDLSILADLRMAIDRKEFWIAYQSQVRAVDGRIVAVEALLRWSSETHGFVPPGRFIPLAERTGLVDRLTDWVVDEALDAQVRWREAGLDLTVSVNVSPLSLRSVDFGGRVRSALEVRSLPAGVLMLEVTESTAFDIPEAVERLGPLRDLGVKISIDDFGTGYTSLAVLPHLPLDELKVDQQFVRDSLTSSASEAIVISVCELAHRLGLSAVAEGVEDALLAERMASYGFDLLQGYHFARPLPEADLVELLRSEPEDVRADATVAAALAVPSASEPMAGTIEHHPIGIGRWA